MPKPFYKAKINLLLIKWPVYIFTFGGINSGQVNVRGIQIFLVQFQALKLCKEMLNAANIYLFEIKRTKCKYIDKSFVTFCSQPEIVNILMLH